ncbi:hypothetical protein ACI2OX_03565 [Bacillus sp. N9]
MPDVEPISLTKEDFSRIQFHRLNMHYKPVIHLAQLLHECTLLSHRSGNWSLFSAEINDHDMHGIFEKFLLGFYRAEQLEYSVGAEQLQWKLDGNPSFCREC